MEYLPFLGLVLDLVRSVLSGGLDSSAEEEAVYGAIRAAHDALARRKYAAGQQQ